MAPSPIRVLIVDDMRASCEILRLAMQHAGGFEVVGVAGDGLEAQRLAKSMMPDLITMDVEMPHANGIEAIRGIMSSVPTPIVVVSSHLNNAAMNVTFDALDAGALDVVQKPTLGIFADGSGELDRLVEKLRAMAEVKVIKRRGRPSKAPPPSAPMRPGNAVAPIELVAIGSSAGGPQALARIVEKLPADYPWPIIVTQHMVEGFIVGAAQWLKAHGKMNVKVAEQGEPLRGGSVYFAPDRAHLRLGRSPAGALIARIDRDGPIGGFQPSVSAMLHSVAETCGQRALGGILTGMGHDGDDGLLAMFRRGAITFAQDENTSMIFGMPKSAIDAGGVRHTLALEKIAPFMLRPSLGGK
jgi:two-component system, chemotaxis family, protein-glutamate methylesterase/glutaminase